MKKFVAILLSILTVVSLLGGVTAFAENERAYLALADDTPISYKEVHDAKAYVSVFYLANSIFSYEFDVILPDGSVRPLKAEKDITAEDRKNVQYLSYGEPYIDFAELEEAKKNGESTVPVHVYLTLSEKDADSDTFSVLYKRDVTVEKPMVFTVIASITPTENLPAYAYEGSESAVLDATVFEVKYWDGTPKTLTPVKTATDEKAHYTLDGKELSYDVNHDSKRIFISYLDSSCFIEIPEIKEFPFESIELIECELQGDMPVKLTYKIFRKGSIQAEKYVKEVNAYSGYIDSIDGYPVEYFTEGSKYTSTVEISLGNSLKDSKTYEMEQQSFLQKLIAKIVWFFKQIFAAGIF